MNSLMKDLRQEHQGLRQLLALLQKKLSMLEQGIPPNFNLIDSVIKYIENYARRYHHPKEDIIYQYIIDHNLDNRGAFSKILKEHNKFDQHTEPLKLSLQSILLDIILSRDVFIIQLRDFIQAEQDHLNQEDEYIYPLIESLLTETEWAAITQLVPAQNDDPLFGQIVHDEYQDLFARLREVEES